MVGSRASSSSVSHSLSLSTAIGQGPSPSSILYILGGEIMEREGKEGHCSDRVIVRGEKHGRWIVRCSEILMKIGNKRKPSFTLEVTLGSNKVETRCEVSKRFRAVS